MTIRSRAAFSEILSKRPGPLFRLEGARNFCLAMIHDLESKQDAPTDGAPAVTLLPKQA